MKKKPDLVSESNSLIESSYKLGLDEQRLIVASLQTFDQSQRMPDKVRVYASDFAAIFKIDPKSVYKQVEEAATKLYERSIYTHDESTGKRIKKRWIITTTYQDSEGYVEITYHNEIKPYLSMLKDKITTYDPHGLAGLSSSYSFRLFKILIAHLSSGEVSYPVNKLRDMLGVDDQKYPKFGEFRRNVLDKAVSDLNKNSQLCIENHFVKNGRTIIAIKFTIKNQTQGTLDLGV